MPKYYIKSGQIKYIIDRDSHEEAILDTLKHYHGKGLMTSYRICVSEQGFEDFRQWKCYDTDGFMKKLTQDN